MAVITAGGDLVLIKTSLFFPVNQVVLNMLTTMVDKIPWDTCVIALIFCV